MPSVSGIDIFQSKMLPIINAVGLCEFGRFHSCWLKSLAIGSLHCNSRGHSPYSNMGWRLRHYWKLRFLPGVESSNDVYHILKTSPRQQAASDHAAISAFAVHRNRNISIDL